MKVSSINLASWVGSLAITGTLGAYVYDAYPTLQEPAPYATKADKEARARANEALSGARLTKPTKEWKINYKSTVRPNFMDHDWTGKPVVVQERPKIDNTPVEAPRVEIKDLLWPIYFQVDTGDAGGSAVLVQYLGALQAEGAAELRVADTLPAPHDGIVVVAIETDSIEFSFSEEGRENEVFAPNFLDETVIAKVPDGEEAKVVTSSTKLITKEGEIVDNRPQQTVRVNNTFQVGTSDLDYLNQNFETVLSKEIRTRTHYGPNGERAGVEIMDVAPGSFAQRHGAQAGDVVISINGNAVNSRQEAIQWAKENGEGIDVFEVVVQRLGLLETIIYRRPAEN